MRRSLTLLFALATLLVAAPSAHAVADTGAIAAALQRDPLYVDPSFADVFSAAEERQVRAAIRAQDAPIYIALVPLRKGDRFDGSTIDFLKALVPRVGDTDAVYVAFSEYSPYATSDDDALDERIRMASNVARNEIAYDAPVVDQLLTLLDAFGDPELAARDKRADAAEKRKQAEYEKRNGNRAFGGDGDGGVPVWVIVVGAFVVLAVAGGVASARRGGRRGRGGTVAQSAPPLLPERVFEYARQARFEDLRDRAREEAIKLSETIDEQPTPKRGPALAAYERAVESAAAASKLHDRATRIVELAGVLVLVDDGREALREAADLAAGHRHQTAKPLCFFDPLHGRSVREVRWEDRDVAACTACSRDVKAGKDPEALREDGVPWFERDGALAATGMGHFSKDLPARLGRGDQP